MCDRLLPHQLDYDWRFTKRTAHELASLVEGYRTLLIGCPTVAEALAGRGGSAILIDRQPAVICSFAGKWIQADVRAEIDLNESDSTFDRIVFDSPWYPDDLLIWLNFALEHSKRGTIIYFSIWPGSTRPSASFEAQEILEEAAHRGRVDRKPLALRYETPGFEHISSEGIGDEWRSGDLASLTVESPTSLRLAKPHLRHTWNRFAFGDLQIALEVPDRRTSAPSVAPVFRSWRLPSVSRRQSYLHRIQIWTSDNRVGRITGKKHFHNALHALVGGEEGALQGRDRSALHVLRFNGFVPDKIPRRRLEWSQFD